MAEILGFANNPTGTTPLAFAAPEGTRALVILTGTNLNFFADYDDLLVEGAPIAPLEVDVGGTPLTVVEVPTGELVNQPARAYFVASPPTGTIEIIPDPDTTSFINVWAIGGERDVEVVDSRGLVSASIANPSVTMQPGGRANTVLCEIAFSGHDTVSAFAPIDGNWTQHTEIDVGAQGVGVYSRVVADGSATPAGLSQTADDALIICVAVAEVAPPAVLTPEGARHAHMADTPALTAHAVVVPLDATHGHTADTPALAAHSTITPADASHGHTADAPALTAHSTITPVDASHGHTADTLALTAHSVVVPLDATHGHAAGAPALAVVTPVAPADAHHTHTADAPLLLAVGELVPVDAHHIHTADAPALAAHSTVAPADALHMHTASTPAPSASSPQAVPADALHMHAVDVIALAPAYIVVPVGTHHAHTAGAPLVRTEEWRPPEIQTLVAAFTLAVPVHMRFSRVVVIRAAFVLTEHTVMEF